jgi:hypothetical protein
VIVGFGIGIDNEHSGGGVYAAVDHVMKLIVLIGPRGLNPLWYQIHNRRVRRSTVI